MGNKVYVNSLLHSPIKGMMKPAVLSAKLPIYVVLVLWLLYLHIFENFVYSLARF